MAFDKSRFIPSPNNWFSTNIEYEGRGEAKFLDLQGIIQGKTTIRFDEFGESSIAMEVETEQPLEFGLMELFIGNKPCIELKVTTPAGTLSASDHIHYGFQSTDSVIKKINFSVLRPQFDVTNKENAKYWVIPLSNFVSDFRRANPDLDNHPLRIYPTPSVPEDLPDEEKTNARLLVNQKNCLIIFKFGGSLGFIEPLPDFKERKDSLLTRQALYKLTAIMLGEVDSNSIEFSDLDDWFPFDFLLLLGLATGTEVGAPWIEFRDAEGKLVRRIHVRLGHPLFSKGHAAIEEKIHDGIGYLLTKAQSSPSFNQSYLHVALKNLIRGRLDRSSVDNKLRHLFLVFDNLIDEYKITKQLSVSENNKPIVNEVIKQANKEINKLISQAKEKENFTEAEIMERISHGISRAETVKTGFSEDVIALIENFNFPDAKILSDFYKANPQTGRKQKWKNALSHYRGILMHRGYFSFQEGHHDIDDVMRISNHLHDILLRIIFKILGYDRTYQPTVSIMTDSQPIDWVKPDTSASRLGY